MSRAKSQRAPTAARSGVGDFEAQVRQVYANPAAVIEQVGGSWASIATTTVYLTDARFINDFRNI
jgi:enamine deaminase RidA (YjgF/YER057c/UK114 family)